MNNNIFTDDVLDDDPTDELPVLTEAAIVELSARFPSLPPAPAPEASEATVRHPSMAEAIVAELESTARYDRVIEPVPQAEPDASSGADAVAAAAHADLRRLSDELVDRETQLAQLLAELELRGQRIATLEAQLSEAVKAAEATAASAAENSPAPAMPAALETAPQAPPAGAAADREEIAALSSYIAVRRHCWENAEAALAGAEVRIAELKAELQQRLERERQAEERARAKSEQARELRARLIEVARELKHREQELAELQEERAAARTAAPPPPDPMLRAEVLGQLEAQLEHWRAQYAGAVELVAAKDVELAAASQALASLQARLAASERGQRGTAAPGRDPEPATVPAPAYSEARLPERPVLVCVTSDRPVNYPLEKSLMTIGRSGHCDIQILTHFVSREHARLHVDAQRVVIEDLGSKNGIFVNSLRVDRQQLRHSDLVTVGETQFRFVEGTTH